MDVTESHAGLTLEEYKRQGYVMKIGKKGPYFEKEGEKPTPAPVPVKKLKPAEVAKLAAKQRKAKIDWFAGRSFALLALAFILYALAVVLVKSLQ